MVSVITAALVAAVVTSEVARLKKGYRDAEDRTLTEIQHDMIASLDSGDLREPEHFPVCRRAGDDDADELLQFGRYRLYPDKRRGLVR